jgi:hypothetical protein
VPFDAIDQQAVDAQPKTREKTDKEYVSESLIDRLERGFGMMGDFFSAGGGAQFRTDAAPRAAGATQQSPFNIQLQVTAPPGSDVQVTGAQLAQ